MFFLQSFQRRKFYVDFDSETILFLSTEVQFHKIISTHEIYAPKTSQPISIDFLVNNSENSTSFAILEISLNEMENYDVLWNVCRFTRSLWRRKCFRDKVANCALPKNTLSLKREFSHPQWKCSPFLIGGDIDIIHWNKLQIDCLLSR